jgi:hypothetical protein
MAIIHSKKEIISILRVERIFFQEFFIISETGSPFIISKTKVLIASCETRTRMENCNGCGIWLRMHVMV